LRPRRPIRGAGEDHLADTLIELPETYRKSAQRNFQTVGAVPIART
jgi:hypothetical protein